MTISLIIGGIALFGVVLMLLELHSAPEGYEDENGFHLVCYSNRPGAKDVSTIWVTGMEAYGKYRTAGAT
jgi:hypothetical protein